MTAKTKNKDLEQAQNKIKELQEEVANATNQWKRALADYQNLEKRVAQEKEGWIGFAAQQLIHKLLPALDTLRLAVAHSNDQGLQLTLAAFDKALADEGVEQIKTVGTLFDPHTMECVATVPGEENKVLEEIRIGYKKADKILRPAQVKVGKEQNSNIETRNPK